MIRTDNPNSFVIEEYVSKPLLKGQNKNRRWINETELILNGIFQIRSVLLIEDSRSFTIYL